MDVLSRSSYEGFLVRYAEWSVPGVPKNWPVPVPVVEFDSSHRHRDRLHLGHRAINLANGPNISRVEIEISPTEIKQRSRLSSTVTHLIIIKTIAFSKLKL